jgi:hypothetical protein
LDNDWKALKDGIAKLEAPSPLVGDEVARVRAEELRELEQNLDRLVSGQTALREDYKAYGPSRIVTRLRAVPWQLGLVLGLVIPPLPAVPFALDNPVDLPAMGFFEAAAQIIPLMVVVLAVERGIARVSNRIAVVAAYYGAYFVWVAVGEVAALWTLADGYPTGLSFGLVLTALIGGGMLVVLQPLFDEL